MHLILNLPAKELLAPSCLEVMLLTGAGYGLAYALPARWLDRCLYRHAIEEYQVGTLGGSIYSHFFET